MLEHSTNDQIELKICMVTYFHVRNTIFMSEFGYFDFLKDLDVIVTSNMTSNIMKWPKNLMK